MPASNAPISPAASSARYRSLLDPKITVVISDPGQRDFDRPGMKPPVVPGEAKRRPGTHDPRHTLKRRRP
jgi:hypothetical protein